MTHWGRIEKERRVKMRKKNRMRKRKVKRKERRMKKRKMKRKVKERKTRMRMRKVKQVWRKTKRMTIMETIKREIRGVTTLTANAWSGSAIYKTYITKKVTSPSKMSTNTLPWVWTQKRQEGPNVLQEEERPSRGDGSVGTQRKLATNWAATFPSTCKTNIV